MPPRKLGDTLARKYFPFYFTFRETAQSMSSKQRAAFYEAIIEYAVTGAEPSLPKSISGYWPLVKPLLDTSQKRYEAGTNGGRPSKNSSFGFSDSKINGLYKEKEKEKEKENDKEKESKAADAASASVLPTFDIFADFSNGDSELLQALRAYDQMRREKRKTLTDTMRRSLCQQLDDEFQPCEWVEIVKQATRQGWLKFYPLDKDKPTTTPPLEESSSDQLTRILNNLKNMNGGI